MTSIIYVHRLSSANTINSNWFPRIILSYSLVMLLFLWRANMEAVSNYILTLWWKLNSWDLPNHSMGVKCCYSFCHFETVKCFLIFFFFHNFTHPRNLSDIFSLLAPATHIILILIDILHIYYTLYITRFILSPRTDFQEYMN